MKKDKIKRSIATVCGTVVCIAVVGWIGYSAFGYFHSSDTQTATQTEIDLSALDDYMGDLNTEE